MILQCHVHCWAMNEEAAEDLNITDPGLWVKAAFDVTGIKAIKQATDDITDPLYYCTTIYFAAGDSYTIDVPYDKVRELWVQAKGMAVVEPKEEIDL